MDYVENKIETADRVKQFLAKYGNALVTTILVIMLLIVGNQYWQKHKLKMAAQAASIYQNLLMGESNQPQTQALANQLMTEYQNTAYASLAAFVLAKQDISQSNYLGAQQNFNWVIDHTKVASFKSIAQINSARLLLAEKQPQQALDMLNSVSQQEFMGEALLVKGDAYLALQQNDAAKAAYQQAVTELAPTSPLYSYAEMKLYSR
jgi:predicted negative regulator of RcsB-dependent stress response